MNTVSQSFLENKFNNKILLAIILVATLTRFAIPPFLGHIPNFSAIDSLAIFCGAYFSRRLTAIGILLVSVWVGDLFLNKIFTGHWMFFYSGCYWQYMCYALIALLGSTLKNKIQPLRLLGICLSSSLLFFAISNFGVWCSGLLYPLTFDGLVACYVAAIPFFKNTVFSDLFFLMIWFGCFEFIRQGRYQLFQKT